MQTYMAFVGILAVGLGIYLDVEYFGIVGHIWLVGSIIVGRIK